MTAADQRDPHAEHRSVPPSADQHQPPTAVVVQFRAWGYLSSEPDGGTACSIRQSAVLDDGREVTLSDDRGWTTSAPWEALSVAHAVHNIETAVLPDDAETTAQTQEWEGFARRLREAGVVVEVEALRALPFEVLLVVRR